MGFWLLGVFSCQGYINYIEDNILVYSTFNMFTTLTITITSVWHIHIIIPKLGIEDKKKIQSETSIGIGNTTKWNEARSWS